MTKQLEGFCSTSYLERINVTFVFSSDSPGLTVVGKDRETSPTFVVLDIVLFYQIILKLVMATRFSQLVVSLPADPR